MIEVSILHDGAEIGRMRFVKIKGDSEILNDYYVEFGVERLGPDRSVGTYVRGIRHFRLQHNALALILEALSELDLEELKLDQPTSSSDLAGRLDRTMREI